MTTDAVEFTSRGKSKIYPGWWMVLIAALAMVATLPGRTQGLGLVTVPLLRDLRMGEVRFADINFWATVIGSAFCIGFGRMVDRHGARLMLTIVVLLLGMDVVAMSRVTETWGLFATVTLTRGLGQSALSVVSLAIVGKWFARRLPTAMGIYAVLIVIGFCAAFPGVQYAVDQVGWRTVWMWIGIVLIAAVAPIGAIWTRDTPESIGLKLDGGAADSGEASPADLPSGQTGATLREALASPAFWVFAIASALCNLVSSGTTLFNESILNDLGFKTDTFRLVLGVTTFAALVTNLGGGWLAQKWPLGRLMGLGMLLFAASLALLPFAHTRGGILAYAIGNGLAGGVVIVVFFTFWGRIFGRLHLGKIQGAAQVLTVIFSALGPVFFAHWHDRFNSYAGAFESMAVLTLVLGVTCWVIRLPAMAGNNS